jgi:hypothetical protein
MTELIFSKLDIIIEKAISFSPPKRDRITSLLLLTALLGFCIGLQLESEEVRSQLNSYSLTLKLSYRRISDDGICNLKPVKANTDFLYL